jgi:hypothetical protein
MSIECDVAGLKQMAGEWVSAVNAGADDESTEAGLKCLTLGYFSAHATAKTPVERTEAEALMRLALRKQLDRDLGQNPLDKLKAMLGMP